MSSGAMGAPMAGAVRAGATPVAPPSPELAGAGSLLLQESAAIASKNVQTARIVRVRQPRVGPLPRSLRSDGGGGGGGDVERGARHDAEREDEQRAQEERRRHV